MAQTMIELLARAVAIAKVGEVDEVLVPEQCMCFWAADGKQYHVTVEEMPVDEQREIELQAAQVFAEEAAFYDDPRIVRE